MGINPYTYAPSDFPYEEVKTGDFDKINHKTIPTVYGPFLQLLFYLGYKVDPSIYGIKLVFIFFELLSLLFVVLLLREMKIDLRYFIIYSLNPLVILEIYYSGHPESVLTFLVLGCIYFYYRSYFVLSLAFLSLLTLTKYIGFIFLPLYFTRLPPKRATIIGFILYIFIIFCFYFAYFDNNMFAAILNYTRYWEFNGSAYKLLYSLFDDKSQTRLIIGILFMLSCFVIYIRLVKKTITFSYSIFLLLICLFILSPIMHPWYFVIIIPFLSIYPSTALILLSFSLVLSYTTLIPYYASGRILWEENISIILIEYIPFYLLLLYALIKKGRLYPLHRS